ncbi:MAG: hypothetical protein HQ494_04080 [Rhodospirillales bacterium]|nr:hypothetical protein [Rhodospirillales bacterium]
MNIKTTLKSSVAVAALFAVAAPVANAADDTLKSGNKNTLTMSGQVVSALWNGDDGSSNSTFISGGRVTATRVRWIAQGSLNADVTAGATIEIDLPFANNPSGNTLGGTGNATQNVDGVDTNAAATWGVRHQYVWVNHKKFGKLSLGNTGAASEGIAETDLSGDHGATSLMGNNSYGSGIAFVETSGTTPSATAMTPGGVFSNFDGAGRIEVLRYDTPTFYGAQLRAGFINGGTWDVGLFYGAKFGAFQVKASAGYYDTSATSATQNFRTAGSIAVLHDSGLNASFSTGKNNIKSGNNFNSVQTSIDDPTNVYWSVGYKAKLFGVGGTNFNVKYKNTEDLITTAAFDDTDATAWAFSVSQNFDAIGAKVALQYLNMSLDATNAGAKYTFDDIDVISLQTVFAF